MKFLSLSLIIIMSSFSAQAAIWKPTPGTTWQWQLSGGLNPNYNVAMYDIDLFDAPQGFIDLLHYQGKKVICYFSAGSSESWRPDFAQFPEAAIGNQLDEWPGENWLDIRNEQVQLIMMARIDLAKEKGCDGVEPDNVDGYANDSGFLLTGTDQLDYNVFLAAYANSKGLSVGLKNDLEQVAILVPYFDFAVNEECVKYNECAMLKPFTNANKAVFHVEYGNASKATTVCPKTKPLKFSTIIKKLSLNDWVTPCP